MRDHRILIQNQKRADMQREMEAYLRKGGQVVQVAPTVNKGGYANPRAMLDTGVRDVAELIAEAR